MPSLWLPGHPIYERNIHLQGFVLFSNKYVFFNLAGQYGLIPSLAEKNGSYINFGELNLPMPIGKQIEGKV